jgi:hypothetical protein
MIIILHFSNSAHFSLKLAVTRFSMRRGSSDFREKGYFGLLFQIPFPLDCFQKIVIGIVERNINL